MKKSKNILIGKCLKDIREEHHLTQPQLVNRLNEMLRQSQSSDEVSPLFIKIDRYKQYEQGRCIPNTEVLIALSDYYGVSIDYLLGRSKYSQVSNELVGIEFGLSDDALIGIRNIKLISELIENEDRENKRTFTGTPLFYLDYFLSSNLFALFLQDFKNYVFPIHRVPVFYDKKRDTWEAPKDKFSHSKNDDAWNMYLATSPDKPNDNGLFILDDHFLEGLAKNNIDTSIRLLKNDFLKMLKNGREKTFLMKIEE